MQISSRVVAHNFERYPKLEGVTDIDVLEAIVKTIQEKECEDEEKFSGKDQRS